MKWKQEHQDDDDIGVENSGSVEYKAGSEQLDKMGGADVGVHVVVIQEKHQPAQGVSEIYGQQVPDQWLEVAQIDIVEYFSHFQV